MLSTLTELANVKTLYHIRGHLKIQQMCHFLKRSSPDHYFRCSPQFVHIHWSTMTAGHCTCCSLQCSLIMSMPTAAGGNLFMCSTGPSDDIWCSWFCRFFSRNILRQNLNSLNPRYPVVLVCHKSVLFAWLLLEPMEMLCLSLRVLTTVAAGDCSTFRESLILPSVGSRPKYLTC